MATTMITSAAFAKPFIASRSSGPRSVRRSLQIRAAEQPKGGMSENRAGVLPGLNMWPPKPITEHGQPKPEDDPANLAPEPGNVQGWQRVGGPSEEELQKKKKEERENSPWSNPKREGGTQVGGGGEGSAS